MPCAYFRDFVRPAKTYREPDEIEREALRKLSRRARGPADGASAEAIQAALYDVARAIPRYQDMKAKGATPERPGVSNDWFTMLYGVLLGEKPWPALRLFRGALWRCRDPPADRGRALRRLCGARNRLMRVAEADIVHHPGLTGWHRGSLVQPLADEALHRAARDFSATREAHIARRMGGHDDAQDVAASERPVVVIAHSLGVITTLHAAPRIGKKSPAPFSLRRPRRRDAGTAVVDSAFLPIPRARLPVPRGAGRQQRRSLRRSALCAPSRAGYRRALHRRRRGRPYQCRQRPRAWPEGSLAFANFMAKL